MQRQPHSKLHTTQWRSALDYLPGMVILAGLTFAIPLLQWLADRLIEPAGLSRATSDVLIIAVLGGWCIRNRLFDDRILSPAGKRILWLAGTGALVLLAINLLDRPVAGITGQMRSPLEVIEVIVLGPFAEELIFRGAMWSILAHLFRQRTAPESMALVATSVLFGIEHLGYWAQSGWPLPLDAYLHSLSMILAGLIFGIIRLRSRSLMAPVLVHICANGVILLFQ